MDKRKPGFFESFGRSVDESFKDAKDDVRTGLDRIHRGTKEVLGFDEDENYNCHQRETYSEEDAMGQIKKVLMARLEDIATPVGDEFSYSTILNWVKNNHIGNQFYMVKYLNEKSKNTYLFVFFVKDETIMCGKNHPMICYIIKKLPDSILDMFNGKSVFIQKFE